MKRLAALVALLAGLLPPAAAAADAEWTAGYTLGLTRSRFGGVLGDSIPDGQYGFAFGVFVSYPVLPRVRLVPEILITTKGGTFHEPVYVLAFATDSSASDTTIYAGNARRTLDLTYLEAPLVLSASLGVPGGSLVPHVHVGIAPSVRILGRYRSGAPDGIPPADPDDARRFDVSWIAGAGVDLRTRRARMRLDLRYEQGLANVFDRGDAPPGRNRVWGLVFGITP